MTNVAFSIDWLTVTFPLDLNGFWPKNVAIEPQALSKEIPSRRPYNQGVQVGQAKIYWHDQHPEFRVMVVLDGQALAEMRSRNIHDEYLREWIKKHDGKISRVDFAADIFDAGAHAPDIYHAWECDQIMTTSQTVSLIVTGKKAMGGATTYIGSRSSERMIRVYDKGKQQGTKLDWTRVEIELKGQRAHQVLDMTTDMDAQTVLLNVLRDIIEWSDVDWLENLWADKYEEVEIEKLGRPETDHERWIRTVCLPAIEKAAKAGMQGIETALKGIIAEIDENGVHG